MIKLLPKLFNAVADYKVSKGLLSLMFEGYLAETGWIDSFRSQMPVDSNKQPLPWVTYPFIDFILPRLKKEHTLFEYGSGNSTIFYAQRVKQVNAVENDKGWFEKVKNSLPANAKVYYQEVVRGGDYSKFATTLDTAFDIIIVDGRDRVNCCVNAVGALSKNGVLVLDDSERTEYKAALDYLQEKGFKAIHFWGMAPGVKVRKSTTVFYKSDNCLGI